MNFKECYKKANDEINGDKALLEKILTAPTKEKNKITPFVYKFASCAAAIILVGTVVLMPELKDKFAVKEESAEEVCEKSTENAAEENKADTYNTSSVQGYTEEGQKRLKSFAFNKTDDSSDAINPKEAIGALDAEKEDGAPLITADMKDVKNKAAASVQESTDFSLEVNRDKTAFSGNTDEALLASEENNAIAAYSEEEEYFDKSQSITTETEGETANQKAIAHSGGGGSSASMRSTTSSGGSAVKAKSYEPSEIFALIGINEECFIKDGMSLISSDVGYAEFSSEGNILAYEINLVLEKEGTKIIILLTDSVTPLALSVTESSGKISASKTVGTTDIFVTAYNMSKEDITLYINGIN